MSLDTDVGSEWRLRARIDLRGCNASAQYRVFHFRPVNTLVIVVHLLLEGHAPCQNSLSDLGFARIDAEIRSRYALFYSLWWHFQL